MEWFVFETSELERLREDLQNSLPSKSSLLGKFQANERLCLTDKGSQDEGTPLPSPTIFVGPT